MAKCTATDTAMRVTTDAVPVLGGYGDCSDHPVERYMRDAKVMQIVEGTHQVKRLVLSRALKKGYVRGCGGPGAGGDTRRRGLPSNDECAA